MTVDRSDFYFEAANSLNLRNPEDSTRPLACHPVGRSGGVRLVIRNLRKLDREPSRTLDREQSERLAELLRSHASGIARTAPGEYIGVSVTRQGDGTALALRFMGGDRQAHILLDDTHADALADWLERMASGSYAEVS